ncbi:MAG TPA: TerC/Alx family metal homeostasis membrane protein [Candidatus Acidoferrales bacterium]|nr:TerC/Alx family metal homeostasis membrane protein [Candidatus Acidoferrales bacterium]
MGTLPLWIAFNAGVALFLLLDLALFHRRAHAVTWREGALESAAWIAISLTFGAWIYVSHGRTAGLEFFSGYLVEKSLSVDNIFVFLLIFQYFRVDARYQHRLLFWGVLGAVVLRGAMVGLGAVLIERFDWILYVFGAFLLYSGFKLFGADHAVHPEKNPVVRWAQKYLPISKEGSGKKLFVRESGKWLFTPLFLVVIVLETTDLVLAVDSIPAVFGVTRDPFIVYSSNICAILGLRALYFLLAGTLQYFQYLDEGLALTVMFIGAKMLAAPWVHISTEVSLAVVGGIIALSILISIIKANMQMKEQPGKTHTDYTFNTVPVTPELIGQLADGDRVERATAAAKLFNAGLSRVYNFQRHLEANQDLQALIVKQNYGNASPAVPFSAVITVGIAVLPETFEKIRAANGSVELADAPADQDVLEFELEFGESGMPHVHLDILTTSAPGGNGAIARFLAKFGEGIQQVEIDVTDVNRATEILRTLFNIPPIFPATRAGANGTRVNFFLVTTDDNQKLLVEFVEKPR